MKILFSDSRDKTLLYKWVALELEKYGASVCWIIQNHAFNPRVGDVFLIPYPKKAEIKAEKVKNQTPSWIFEKVKRSDRMVNYYGYSADHYHYYYSKILEYVNSVKPDLIVGEPGNFHTHMLCCIAKKLGILFVDPTSARYPTGKFRLNKYDLIDPLVLSGFASAERVSSSCSDEYESLVNRNIVPDYMKKQEASEILKKIKALRLQSKVFLQRIAGEKYGTPSLCEFLRTRFHSSRVIHKWNASSASVDFVKKCGKKKLLYPLQMQPECNLDVWGQKFSNQEEVISTIARSLPSDWVLVVKPNPKSKLEMTQGLINLSHEENIYPLNHAVSMDDVLPHVDNVVTVTGTIALERILASEPVIILGDTDYAKVGKAMSVDSLEYVKDCLTAEAEGLCGKDFYDYLVKTSFPGLITEPTLTNEPLQNRNVANIASVLWKAACY